MLLCEIHVSCSPFWAKPTGNELPLAIKHINCLCNLNGLHLLGSTSLRCLIDSVYQSHSKVSFWPGQAYIFA